MGLFRKLKAACNGGGSSSRRDARVQTRTAVDSGQQASIPADPPPPYALDGPAPAAPFVAPVSEPAPEPTPVKHNENDAHTLLEKVFYTSSATILSDRGHDNEIAFYWAALHGYSHVIRLLLQHNPSPACLNTYRPMNTHPAEYRGWTPAQLAVANSHLEVALLLCDAGANVGSQLQDTAVGYMRNDGNSTLRLPLVKDLLRLWKPPAAGHIHLGPAASVTGLALLNAAISHRKPDVVQWLWENGAKNLALEDEYFVDSAHGKLVAHFTADPHPCMAYLAAQGLQRDLNTAKQAHALFWAVQARKTEELRGLTKTHPGLINLKEADGTTALHLACDKADLPIVEILLQYHADVHATRNILDKRTALETLINHAIWTTTTRTFELLLQHGADANTAEPSTGKTVLRRAAYFGRTGCIEALLARGADRSLLDHEGKTAADVARERRYRGAFKALTGAEMEEDVTPPAEKGKAKAVQSEDDNDKPKLDAAMEEPAAASKTTVTPTSSDPTTTPPPNTRTPAPFGVTDFATLRWD